MARSDLTRPIPDLMMADRKDKPPILRVLVLLVALVSTALALAALSPAQPEPARAGAAADAGATTAAEPAGARRR